MALSMPDVQLTVTLFNNIFSKKPQGWKGSSSSLIHLLGQFPAREDIEDKRKLPAWSPSIYEPSAPRGTAGIVAVSCLVWDFDELPTELPAAPWDDCLQVWHSTWSHTDEDPRGRLIIPLASQVPLDLWSHAWKWCSLFAPGADPSCKDAHRLYIRPARPKATSPMFFEVQPGPQFDLMAVLPPPPPPRRRTARRNSPVRVPARLQSHVIRRRLARDPQARERVAEALGATVAGCGDKVRAERVMCPNCGRQSAWFWITPDRQTRARCQHLNSCGWSGRLDELLLFGRTP